MFSVAVIAGSRTPQLIDGFSKARDTHSYKGYDDSMELLRQLELGAAHHDRVLWVMRSAPQQIMYKWAEYLDVNPSLEVVLVVKEGSEPPHIDILSVYPQVLLAGIEAPSMDLMLHLATASFPELLSEYGKSIEVNEIVTRVEDDSNRNFHKAAEIDSSALSLSQAGSTHADTGFLDEDIDETSLGGFPPLSQVSYDPVPQGTPLYKSHSKGGFSSLGLNTKVVITVSVNSQAGSTFCSRQIFEWVNMGHSVLYVDGQTADVHGLYDLVDDANALENFGFSYTLPYKESGKLYIVTGGFETSSSAEDILSSLPLYKHFDHVIIDLSPERLEVVTRVLQTYPSTPVVMLWPGSVEYVQKLIGKFIGRRFDPTGDFLLAMSQVGLIHLGTPKEDLSPALDMLDYVVWDRVDLSPVLASAIDAANKV